MKQAFKSSLEWNNIDRIFYMGLYRHFNDVRYLREYYRLLDKAIAQRGKWCKHYRGR